MPDTDANFYSVIISILALIISVISLWKTRKTIDVSIEDELFNIEYIYISADDYNSRNPFHKIDNGKILFIKVVNPSPSDIGFFDLQLFDSNKNRVGFIVHGNLRHDKSYKTDQIFFTEPINKTGGRLNLLESNYGMFPSNSFTRIDIPFSSTDIDEITITFKVAIKSYWFNKHAEYRKHYKFFTKTITIDKDQS